MKNLENLNLTNLTINEQIKINGGESAWYYIFYGVGYVAGAVDDFAHSFADSGAYGEWLVYSGSNGGAK